MFSTLGLIRRPFICVFVLAMLADWATKPTQAARPTSSKLLPKSTVAFVSVPDSHELVNRFMQTATGRMSQDAKVKPLINQLYGELTRALAPLEDRLGLSVSDMLNIPQGELTLAVVAPEGALLAPVALLDVHEQIVAVQALLEKADETLRKNGAVKSEETLGDLTLTSYRLRGPGNREVIYFEKDGALVVGADRGVMKSLLAIWGGEEGETLANNTKFSSIMNRCRGGNGEEPQFTWYVDPIELSRVALRDNSAAQLALALLTPLGLNGLQGVGGSVTFATDQFDVINRLHVLLENPRTGVIDAISFSSGDITPERWVANDITSYSTFHFDVRRTYDKVSGLVDSFRGEGSTAATVQSVFERVGVNFDDEVLPALDDRFTYVTWVEKPVTVRSQSQMIGIRIKDAEAFQRVFDKVIDRLGERLEKDAYAGKTYYRFVLPQRRNRRVAEDGQPRPEAPPRPRPCMALLGNYVILADRAGAIEHAIKTSRDDSLSLATSLDFKLIAAKAERQSGGTAPAMLNFNRPEEGLRFVYDLATTDDNRANLRRRAENNQFFGTLNKALEDNPLPSFEHLRDYLAPGGAVLIDEPTGLHYVSFTLRRSDKDDKR